MTSWSNGADVCCPRGDRSRAGDLRPRSRGWPRWHVSTRLSSSTGEQDDRRQRNTTESALLRQTRALLARHAATLALKLCSPASGPEVTNSRARQWSSVGSRQQPGRLETH